ncbi:hypothetical protein [Planotetraspora phitsanulokensis]|nr:hypothetical protein [Planotetraspora phitsanulokensis]
MGQCTGCGRTVPIFKGDRYRGYCRLCRHQARLEAGDYHTPLMPYLQALSGHHQLFLANMDRALSVMRPHGNRRGQPRSKPAAVRLTLPEDEQLELFEPPARDFTRFRTKEHAEYTAPWVLYTTQIAARLSEARGWSAEVTQRTRRGLVILMSSYPGFGRLRRSEVMPLHARQLPVERVCDVLEEIGLLIDDRAAALDLWLDRALSGLASGIRSDVLIWINELRHGTPRRRPRQERTIHAAVPYVRPLLEHWSQSYDHLREVTKDDLHESIKPLTGTPRRHTILALRSLFGCLKRRKVIFRNPAARLRPGGTLDRARVPLDQAELDLAIKRAGTPTHRIILVLAAIHALRRKAICLLTLEDVDLANRRMTVNDHTRPLDHVTARAIQEYLDYRRQRWPNTANPHLLITQQTAHETQPVSLFWVGKHFRGLPATLERLRVDRHLDEALANGADPLHLAIVFGMSDTTAVRYATAARRIMEESASRLGGELEA